MLVNPDASGVTWGRVVIEAMCVAVPVVSYGTDQEYVEDGVTGYLVRTGDFDGLLQSVRILLAEPARAREMGYRAQSRIARIYQRTRTAVAQAFGVSTVEATRQDDLANAHKTR